VRGIYHQFLWPESFKVLIKELQALGLSVEILNENEEEIRFIEDTGSYPLPDLGGINLQGLLPVHLRGRKT
jgi:DNA-directed RNA polymerase subunit beta